MSTIILQNQQAVVNSRSIAETFDRLHKNVLPVIDSLIKKGVISRLEFKPRDYMSRGKKYRSYDLTEGGFLKAMPFVGGERAEEGQKILVDEFLSMKKRLGKQAKKRESLAFQLMRSSGKDAHKILTDEIQKLDDDAKAAGSKNKWRYKNITDAIYKSFLIIEPKASGVRDLLTPIQLSQLQTIELTIAELISTELAKETHYKSIYPLIKKKLSALAIPKTELLGNGE